MADGAGAGGLIADEAATLTDLLINVTDPNANERLSDAAREHFMCSYSREAVFARYDDVFGHP